MFWCRRLACQKNSITMWSHPFFPLLDQQTCKIWSSMSRKEGKWVILEELIAHQLVPCGFKFSHANVIDKCCCPWAKVSKQIQLPTIVLARLYYTFCICAVMMTSKPQSICSKTLSVSNLCSNFLVLLII